MSVDGYMSAKGDPSALQRTTTGLGTIRGSWN